MRVLVHAPGPARHGVVRHAAAVAALAARHGVEPVATGSADLGHAQFTDALYGPDIDAAATAFEAWARTAPRPLVVTLHDLPTLPDLPGADPDPARDARRRRGYARVASCADAVVVSSAHEAAAVAGCVATGCVVIPLPLERLPAGAPAPGWAGVPSLGVLGFVYPGKGHAAAIDAAARRSDRPLVVAAGAVAPGHDDLHTRLRDRAAAGGVRLLVTGSLSDAGLAAAAAAVTVPLAPALRVSASGSLATWLGCGRRPATARGAYTAEVAARHPGAVDLYDDDAGLDSLVDRGLADPSSTRRSPGDPEPDVGAAHAALYRGLLGC